ncbi:hypothetical protein SAMN04487898_103331 [Pedobacter sp. ok626]|uniref:hypothetical protein n=1 Tax=Pedobacter sp. ok626 TaxID=1761882 RepID=UPI00087ED01C|nr:hypothetical protein [Pedobacter sp. ok626]SDJ58826.1 hypothetical protein SAMN04487898_103331 [Pedobacter sp. ok626]
MNFIRWNNLIGGYFFKPEHAGKDVHLFMTKGDIIALGKPNMKDDHTDEEVWQNFLWTLRYGLSGSGNVSIFEKALYAAEKWKTSGFRTIESKPQQFPPYISYLVFTVLPLTEVQGDYNSNNYYDRLAEFITVNQIFELTPGRVKKLQNLKNRLREIDCLWDELSQWANHRMNGQLGNFHVISFSHSTWKFVGKPFSQCVLPPKSLKQIPNFFYQSDLVPNTFYRDDIFKRLLLKNGVSLLGLKNSVVELIRKGEKDEIGRSVIGMVRAEFLKWTGEAHDTVLKDGKQREIRKMTVVPLKLQFKLSEDGELIFSYRAKYASEPPSSLKLGEYEDIYENENWSKTLAVGFSESIVLKDLVNKWKALFDVKRIHFFITGSYFNMNNRFWIETDVLSKTERMYMLCKIGIRDIISGWGRESCQSFREELRFKGLPKGYSLFSFLGPKSSHQTLSELTVYDLKEVSIREGTGLRVGYLSYLNRLLPEVEITNADGDETVFIQYADEQEHIILKQHQDLKNIWLLPADLHLYKRFTIQVLGSTIFGSSKAYQLLDSFHEHLDSTDFPKRNRFFSEDELAKDFVMGNQVELSRKINIDGNISYFSSSIKVGDDAQEELEVNGSFLLDWLLAVKDCKINRFYEAFGVVHQHLYPEDNDHIQEKRKASVNLLDYLGFIDFDYRTENIFALPPKLIYVTTDKGRKALLIGCRNKRLIDKMVEYCRKSNGGIRMSIKPQTKSNQLKLIPEAITLESNYEREFKGIAEYCGIGFDDWHILKLKELVPSLGEYVEFMKSNGTTEPWDSNVTTSIFNKDSLKFVPIEEYPKVFTLCEYRPRYAPEYGIWIDNNHFVVDKSWGKYMLLNHNAAKIAGWEPGSEFAKTMELFFNGSNIAIPTSLPFPKLFSRMILQLSGVAPEFKKMNLKGKEVYYNVYRSIPRLFLENFLKKKLNILIESTKQLL